MSITHRRVLGWSIPEHPCKSVLLQLDPKRHASPRIKQTVESKSQSAEHLCKEVVVEVRVGSFGGIQVESESFEKIPDYAALKTLMFNLPLE